MFSFYKSNKNKSLKKVEKPEDIPEEKHYVILVFDSYSEDNYGETSYTPFTDYWATTDYDVWKNVITEYYEENSSYKKKISAVVVEGKPKISMSISIG